MNSRLKIWITATVATLITVIIALGVAWYYVAWRPQPASLADDSAKYIAYVHSESDYYGYVPGAIVLYNGNGEAVKVRQFDGLASTVIVPYGENYAITGKNQLEVIDRDLNTVEILDTTRTFLQKNVSQFTAGDYSILVNRPFDNYYDDEAKGFVFGPHGVKDLGKIKGYRDSFLCPDGRLFLLRFTEVPEDNNLRFQHYILQVIDPDGTAKEYSFPKAIGHIQPIYDGVDCKTATTKFTVLDELAPDALQVEQPNVPIEWSNGAPHIPADPRVPDHLRYNLWLGLGGSKLDVVKVQRASAIPWDDGPSEAIGAVGSFATFLSAEGNLQFESLADGSIYDQGVVDCKGLNGEPDGGPVHGTIMDRYLMYMCFHSGRYIDENPTSPDWHASYLVGRVEYDESGVPKMPDFEHIHLQNIIPGRTPGLDANSKIYMDVLTIHSFLPLDYYG